MMRAAAAAGSPRTCQMETRLFERYGAGQDEEVMRLTIAPSGVVSGWYRDADTLL